MVKYTYGTLPDEQFEKYRKILHKKVFWLLVYRDPSTAEQYSHVDFDQYMERLMEYLDAMNRLLCYPAEMLEIMGMLESAWQDTKAEPFDYRKFRRKILEAHSLIDRLGKEQ